MKKQGNFDRKSPKKNTGRPGKSSESVTGKSADSRPGKPTASRSGKPAASRSGKPAASRSGKSVVRRPGKPTVSRSRKSKESVPRKSSPPSEEIRLNRYIASSGICSRREADTYIKAGLVTVNGELVTEMGRKVKPGDEIRYNGQRIKNERLVYILLNKPKDYITTLKDPHASHTVMELVRNACKERIYPVGRLDRNTTGVLLLTNDGELTGVLTHPSYNRLKVYHVGLNKAVTANDMKKILEGIKLEDGIIQADAISYSDPTDKKMVGIEIHSGKNRIVRRIFEHLGYTVKKLDRVYFAGLTKKGLTRGQWRFLTENEIRMLKMGSFK